MKEETGGSLVINWRYFSLEQVNSQEGPDWKLWEQPEGYPSRGLRAFWAAEAARNQGEALFAAFHIDLLRARHEQRRKINDIDTLSEVGEGAHLDMTRFQEDLKDRRLLAKLAEDHAFAVEKLSVFGTPTLVFPEGRAVFLKMSNPPTPKECLPVFKELRQLVEQRDYVLEVKRPQRPQ